MPRTEGAVKAALNQAYLESGTSSRQPLCTLLPPWNHPKAGDLTVSPGGVFNLFLQSQVVF